MTGVGPLNLVRVSKTHVLGLSRTGISYPYKSSETKILNKCCVVCMTSSGFTKKEIGQLSPNNDNAPAYFYISFLGLDTWVWILWNRVRIRSDPYNFAGSRSAFRACWSWSDTTILKNSYRYRYFKIFPFVADFIFISLEKFYDGLNCSVVLLCTLKIFRY